MGKKLSIVGIALVGFLGPLEYSVVMPSLWYYLLEFGRDSVIYYDIVLASFPFAHMITSPLFGWLADRRSMKELLIIGLGISAVGHAIYALAWDEWAILLGRFVGGIGAANFMLVSVYIARITTVEDRTSMTAKINIFTEMGLLMGPALAVLFDLMDFQWGPFDVNKYTAPGYMMFLCCVLLMIYLIFCFDNPEVVMELGRNNDTFNSIRSSGDELSKDKPINGEIHVQSGPAKNEKLSVLLKRVLTRSTLTVFFAQFILFFNQTGMEAILVPLTEEFYGFTPLENSLIFVGITIVFLIMYAIITNISRHVQDRTLIALGIIFETIALTMGTLVFIFIEIPPFWLFVIVCFFFVVGLPFFFCCASSLLTKLVDQNDVGVASGLLSSCMNLANIAGPLWAGTFEIYTWLPFAGELALVLMLSAVFITSWRRLYIPKTPVLIVEGDATETTPLVN